MVDHVPTLATDQDGHGAPGMPFKPRRPRCEHDRVASLGFRRLDDCLRRKVREEHCFTYDFGTVKQRRTGPFVTADHGIAAVITLTRSPVRLATKQSRVLLPSRPSEPSA